MTVEVRLYDPAEYLDNEEAIEAYLVESRKTAVEIDDPTFLAHALATVARARVGHPDSFQP
jgi:DNA-binding phage protein